MRPVALAALVGCAGPDDGGKDAETRPDEQGAVVGVRTLDGERPVTDGDLRVSLGGASPAVPDAAGFAYFFDVTPDRVPVSADLVGQAGAWAAPEIRPDALSGVSLVVLPLPAAAAIPDAAFEAALEGDGFRVEVPGGALSLDDTAPATGAYDLLGHRVREADRAGAPAVQIAIRDDVDLQPIVIHELLVVRAWQDDERLRLLPEETARVTVEVDPGSPLLVPDAPVRAWTLSGSSAYWAGAGPVTVDPAAATISFTPGVLGWWALGFEEPARGCVTGRLVDAAGQGIPGVGVRATEAGILGVDGATALDGAFCVPVSPGATTELRAIGFARDRSALYLWSGSATGGEAAACGEPACVDLGDLPMEVFPDADGDRYWGGPGGDCDDADPAVNPTVAFGDASYCGGAL